MKKQSSAPVKNKPQTETASANTANPKPHGKAYTFFAHALDSFYALLNTKKQSANIKYPDAKILIG